MLSPEVLNFNPPRSAFQVERVDRHKTNSKVASGNFGHIFKTVTVVTPGVEHLPDVVINIFKDRCVYRVKGVPAHSFIEDGFLSHFVQKGKIVGSSITTWPDFENSAKIEDGKLKFSVTKETHEELGLTGKPTLVVNRVPSLYEISINLTDPGFKPSSKLYQRVLWCLKDRLNLTFDWIISWVPHDENVCPSSLAAYWDYHGFHVEEQRDSMQQTCLKKLNVPELTDSGSWDFYDLLEWVGATALGIRCAEEETYESSLTIAEPCNVVEETSVVGYDGVFSNHSVSALLEQLLALLEDDSESTSWVNVTCHDLNNGLVSFFLTRETSTVCRLYRPTIKIK